MKSLDNKKEQQLESGKEGYLLGRMAFSAGLVPSIIGKGAFSICDSFAASSNFRSLLT
jgi:hypothetical protein